MRVAIGALALFGCANANLAQGTPPDGGGKDVDAPRAHEIDAAIDAPRPIDAPPPMIDAPQSGGPVTLSQTTSAQVVAGNSFNCNYGSPTFYTAENSYYRVFRLADYGITNTLHVTSVQFLVETALSGGGTGQPATVNIGTYAGTVGAVTLDTTQVTQVATANITIPDGNATTVVAPIAGDIAAGTNLIVEILIPDGNAASNEFFIGSNSAGESQPGYIRAPTCATTSPTTFASIAAANSLAANDIILTVSGAH